MHRGAIGTTEVWHVVRRGGLVGIDRLVRNIRTGRFERLLSALTGGRRRGDRASRSTSSTTGASFGNKICGSRSRSGPLGARRRHRRRLQQAGGEDRAAGRVGADRRQRRAGLLLHARGIAQRPGGWKIARYNVEMGPPLFAPLLVTMVGGMGLLRGDPAPRGRVADEQQARRATTRWSRRRPEPALPGLRRARRGRHAGTT